MQRRHYYWCAGGSSSSRTWMSWSSSLVGLLPLPCQEARCWIQTKTLLPHLSLGASSIARGIRHVGTKRRLNRLCVWGKHLLQVFWLWSSHGDSLLQGDSWVSGCDGDSNRTTWRHLQWCRRLGLWRGGDLLSDFFYFTIWNDIVTIYCLYFFVFSQMTISKLHISGFVGHASHLVFPRRRQDCLDPVQWHRRKENKENHDNDED